MQPTTVQRVENAAVAIAVIIAFVVSDAAWWWPLALFLAFDVSAAGYVAGPRVGAVTYNTVHNYAVPALLALTWLGLDMTGTPPGWVAVLAGSWAFHVAVDRALGYGLKHAEGFTHTHLGPIGAARGHSRAQRPA